MTRKRKRRIYFVAIIIIGVALVISLVLYALRQNINLYFTPTQLLSKPVAATVNIRVGGIVRDGSIHRDQAVNSLTVYFVITDLVNDIAVEFNGILPDLFKEGQGVVALGTLGTDNIFRAKQILAKHDENYMPPRSKNVS